MEIPSTFIVRQPEAAKSSEDIDFRRYWQAVKRRLIPAAGVSAVVLALTAAAIASQKASYTATGKLLMKPDEIPSLTGLDSSEMREFEPLTIQSNPLKTEIEILKSQPLIQKAVDLLNLKNADGSAPPASAVSSQLEVDVSGGTDVLKVAYSSDDPELAAVMVNTLMKLYIANNIELNQAETIAARDFITDELPSAEDAVQRAERALSEFKQNNQLVTIEDEARSAVEFVTRLDEKIASTQSDLASTNAQVSIIQNRLGVSAAQAIDLSAVSQSQGVQEASSELQSLETQLTEARSFFKDSSPQVIALQEKVSSLRSLLKQRVQQVVGPQGTVGQNLQIGELEQSLINEFVDLEVERLGLNSQVYALDLARGSYSQRMNDLPGLERQQRVLERRLDAVQGTYETLLTKLQELKTTENQSLGNARIIEEANVPSSATLSKKTVAMGLGGGTLSLLAFAATVMLLESRDRTIKTTEELKKIYGCDLLETIPQTVPKGELIQKNTSRSFDAGHTEHLPVSIDTLVSVRDYPRSLISEVYRSLQVKLQYFNEIRSFKAIAVVSATPEENCSIVAANLAMATAELKQRILLIDGNLRSPNQAALWHLSSDMADPLSNEMPGRNEVGLSDVLQGETSLQSAIRQVNSHLWVLPAGHEPPSPLALLRSPKMQALMRAVAQNFDAVIIDTPSLLSAPDGLVLGKLADGVVVVSQLGKVERANLVAASDSLKKSHQSVLGLVITETAAKDQTGDRWLYEPSPAGHLPSRVGSSQAGSQNGPADVSAESLQLSFPDASSNGRPNNRPNNSG